MSSNNDFTRRELISSVAGGAIGVGVASMLGRNEAIAAPQATVAAMPTRPLGRTGWDASLFSIGGQALLDRAGNEDEAEAIINRAIDLGVNYIDTAALYGGGVSERNFGRVMKTRRKEVYLATKTISRDYDGAMRDLENSLHNLQTDHIDCWQLHTVRSKEDEQQVFGPNGALKALEKARDEKIVRFLGITGHKQPFVLKRSIERFPFDTILMALNPADKSMPDNENDASFIENLLPIAVEKKMGIIGMKVAAGGAMFHGRGFGSIEDSIRYVLSLPISTIVVGISRMKDLEENVRIAKQFLQLSPKEMAKVETAFRPHAAEATWFKQAW